MQTSCGSLMDMLRPLYVGSSNCLCLSVKPEEVILLSTEGDRLRSTDGAVLIAVGVTSF